MVQYEFGWEILKSYSIEEAMGIIDIAKEVIKNNGRVYEENFGDMNSWEGYKFYLAIFQFLDGYRTNDKTKVFIPAIGVINDSDRNYITKFTPFYVEKLNLCISDMHLTNIWFNELIQLDLDKMKLVKYYGRVKIE